LLFELELVADCEIDVDLAFVGDDDADFEVDCIGDLETDLDLVGLNLNNFGLFDVESGFETSLFELEFVADCEVDVDAAFADGDTDFDPDLDSDFDANLDLDFEVDVVGDLETDLDLEGSFTLNNLGFCFFKSSPPSN
jgi:hypothetical protein